MIRKQELWKSCATLGILPENITLLKHDHLKDGPKTVWSFHHLSPVIIHHIQSLQIDTVSSHFYFIFIMLMFYKKLNIIIRSKKNSNSLIKLSNDHSIFFTWVGNLPRGKKNLSHQKFRSMKKISFRRGGGGEGGKVRPPGRKKIFRMLE